MRELDEELVPTGREREAGLRGVETHDHAIAVLEPDFPVRLGGHSEAASALDPGT